MFKTDRVIYSFFFRMLTLRVKFNYTRIQIPCFGKKRTLIGTWIILEFWSIPPNLDTHTISLSKKDTFLYLGIYTCKSLSYLIFILCVCLITFVDWIIFGSHENLIFMHKNWFNDRTYSFLRCQSKIAITATTCPLTSHYISHQQTFQSSIEVNLILSPDPSCTFSMLYRNDRGLPLIICFP